MFYLARLIKNCLRNAIVCLDITAILFVMRHQMHDFKQDDVYTNNQWPYHKHLLRVRSIVLPEGQLVQLKLESRSGLSSGQNRQVWKVVSKYWPWSQGWQLLVS